MQATVESLHEGYSSMNTEALADLYHEGELTYLAVSVLHEVITSRGLDWAQFTKLPTTEPESGPRSDWELWKSESKQVADGEIRLESKHKANGTDVGAKLIYLGIAIWGFYILSFEAVEIYRIGNWQLVDGTVEHVSEEFVCCDGGFTDFEINYSYSVGEITYRGMHSEIFNLLPTPDYEMGASISVYYDEINPRDSLVDVGTWYHYADVAKGLLFLGFGGIVVFSWIEDRKKSSTRSSSVQREP